MGILSALRKAQAKNQSQGQGSMPAAPRPTLIQGGPAYFTPEGYVPPVQPEQAFMPTDVMRDPIADMFAAQPPLTRGPSLPKPPIPPREDQIFIDDMPPLRPEPPMIVEEPPVIVDEPSITIEDIDEIRRGRGGPRGMGGPQIQRAIGMGGDMMPPTIKVPPRELPPTRDFTVGLGRVPISATLPEDFFIEEDLPKPPPTREKILQKPIMPPRRDDFMSIDRLIDRDRPLPRLDIMPISLPEPMPMLPEPMPMRPRMPMPGPIATPMPMAPINLPKIELPKIERNEPMMPRSRGIDSLYSPRMMMAEGGEVVEPLGHFTVEDLPLTNYIFSLQSPERSELVNNLIGVTGITVGSAESIPMFVKRLIQTGSLNQPEVKEVIQESLEKNTSQ